MNSSIPPCYIGIDFAIASDHVLSIRTEGAEQRTCRIPPDPIAIDAFVADLLTANPQTSFHVAMEAGCPTLMRTLERHEHLKLYPLNPLAVASFRTSLSVGGAKSDPADAALIRLMLEERIDHLRPYCPGDDAARRIEQLAEDRLCFVSHRVRVGNQLLEALRRFCPALVREFNAASSSLAKLVRHSPGLAPLQSRRDKTLHDILKKGRRSETSIAGIIRAIRETPADMHCPVASEKAKQLAGLYLELSRTVGRYEQQLRQVYSEHPDRKLGESLPGAGELIAPQILAKLGLDRNRWASANELACAMGIAPVRIQSGRATPLVRRRYACNKIGLQLFFQFARCSVRYCDWAREYFSVKRAAGKRAAVIYRALAFKWIRIIFACWKNHSAYDPQKVRSAYLKTGATPCS
jgi:transposase